MTGSNTDKRKKKTLTLRERLEILEKLKAKIPINELSEEYGVSKSTITRIKNSEDDITEKCKVLESCDGNLDKKRFTGVENSILETSLYEWFSQRRIAGLPISGLMLQEKAKSLNTKFKLNDKFQASSGWLSRFKARHGIRSVLMHGEKLSADEDASNDFKINLNKIIDITELSLDKIYNCDETGLYWRVLPNRSLITRHEKCVSGRKQSKTRITVMVCTNASGTHRLPLYVIGKYEHPRCFKGMGQLPVEYRHQESAWMDKELMADWFQSVFLTEIKKFHNFTDNKKVLLIMDNAPCHLSEESFNSLSDCCTVFFLPPNVTSLIQPMDQGIIEKFKRSYKKLVVSTLEDEETREGVDGALKRFNLLNCLNLASVAWKSVTPTDIRHCWKKLIPMNDVSTGNIELSNIDSIDLTKMQSKMPEFCKFFYKQIQTWLTIDNEDVGWEMLDDEEIVQKVITDTSADMTITNNEECDNSMTDPDVFIEISPLEAYKAVNMLINFYQASDSELHDSFLSVLKICHEDIISKISIIHNI